MDPSQYLKNYPQALHLHPNSSFRLHNNSQDGSFRHSSPRSRGRSQFNRSRGTPYNRHRHQNSESQYSNDSFNDSSGSSNMSSPCHRKFNQRNFHSSSQADISQYFHASMLEDPWVGLITTSITQSRHAHRQSGQVATYDYSSSDEETTPSAKPDGSDGTSGEESGGDSDEDGGDDGDDVEAEVWLVSLVVAMRNVQNK